MTTRKLFTTCATTALVMSLPFMILHLIANPDDAHISLGQHITAALANLFGPWGAAIVRLVDFPNAGFRSFSSPLAIALTVAGALLIALSIRMRNRYPPYLFIVSWALFAIVWLVTGFGQIAAGLL